MTEVFNAYNFIIGGLSVGLLGSFYMVFRLLKKVEMYEDYISDIEQYFINISKELSEGRKYLDDLDSRGILQADDEIGTFFEAMKEVQDNLDKFILADTKHAQKKKQS